MLCLVQKLTAHVGSILTLLQALSRSESSAP